MLNANEDDTNEVPLVDIYPDPAVPQSPRVTMYQSEVGGLVSIDALVSLQHAADFLRLVTASGTKVDPDVLAG
jgi:hypothetical protein